MSGEANELHLPHGSWWPVAVALGITFLGVGIVMGGIMLGFGILALVASLIGWIVEDHKWWNEKLGTGEGVGRFGIAIFMSSEIFLFGALFATYFTFKGQSPEWPDQVVHLPVVKTALFSIALISSSLTAYIAEKKLHAGNKKGFHFWWLTTIVLGAVFLLGQVLEYKTLLSEGVGLSTSHFASSFYMITGTHGLHVLGGLIFLIVVYIRSLKGQFTSDRNLAPTAASWYWHFVDVIWVIVFTVLYIIQ